MKTYLIILILLIFLSKSQRIDLINSLVREKKLYKDFKYKFHRKYNLIEDEFRFKIFQKNLKFFLNKEDCEGPNQYMISCINKNKKKKRLYKKKMNKFADVSAKEFADLFLLPYKYLYRKTLSEEKGIPGWKNYKRPTKIEVNNLNLDKKENFKSNITNIYINISNQKNYKSYSNLNKIEYKTNDYENLNNYINSNDYEIINNFIKKNHLENTNKIKKIFQSENSHENPKKNSKTSKKNDAFRTYFKLTDPSNLKKTNKNDFRNYFLPKASGRNLQELQIPILRKKIFWKKKLTKIKNQNKCNSCYVFSAIAALEAHNNIYNENKNEIFSEQEILDCDFGNFECKGGQPSAVFQYIVDNGIGYERQYPYVGKKNGICYRDFDFFETFKEGRQLQESAEGFGVENGFGFEENDNLPQNKKTENKKFSKKKRKIYKNLKTFLFINPNIISLLKELIYGPVVVAHFASEQFKFYSKGIYDGEGCENINTVNHSSILVGYDLEAEEPYMEFKNSWGTKWGIKGYYKMLIGDLSYGNQGLCLVAGTRFNVSPVVVSG